MSAAASATIHAVEFNRRELLVMRLMLDSQRDDSAAAAHTDDADELRATIVAAASDPQHAIPEHLQQLPWFGIAVRFVATRLDGDLLQAQ
jgi:hypothetical protein